MTPAPGLVLPAPTGLWRPTSSAWRVRDRLRQAMASFHRRGCCPPVHGLRSCVTGEIFVIANGLFPANDLGKVAMYERTTECGTIEAISCAAPGVPVVPLADITLAPISQVFGCADNDCSCLDIPSWAGSYLLGGGPITLAVVSVAGCSQTVEPAVTSANAWNGVMTATGVIYVGGGVAAEVYKSPPGIGSWLGRALLSATLFRGADAQACFLWLSFTFPSVEFDGEMYEVSSRYNPKTLVDGTPAGTYGWLCNGDVELNLS